MLLRSALRVRLPNRLLGGTKPAYLRCQATPSSSSEAGPSKPNIKELASNARVRVADEEQVDISSVPPSMHGTQQSTTLRADEPVMCANR
eukprot:914299-Pelagomonas_calceolata.AAC.3